MLYTVKVARYHVERTFGFDDLIIALEWALWGQDSGAHYVMSIQHGERVLYDHNAFFEVLCAYYAYYDDEEPEKYQQVLWEAQKTHDEIIGQGRLFD